MHIEDHIEALAFIFQCGDDSAKMLCEIFMAQAFRSRQVLAHQGDVSPFCWLVIEGSVAMHAFGVDGQRQQLARYGPGEFLGAYPRSTYHRAEIETVPATLLLRAEAETLANLVATNVEISAGMASLLARQLDRALDRMAWRTTYSAAGRVYNELLALAGSAGAINPAPQITTLALGANTTRETASRAITVLVRRGIVSRDGSKLVIHSPRMLRDLIV